MNCVLFVKVAGVPYVIFDTNILIYADRGVLDAKELIMNTQSRRSGNGSIVARHDGIQKRTISDKPKKRC